MWPDWISNMGPLAQVRGATHSATGPGLDNRLKITGQCFLISTTIKISQPQT